MDAATFRSAAAEATRLREDMGMDALREARFRLAVARACRDPRAIDRWTAVSLLLIDRMPQARQASPAFPAAPC